MPPFSCCNTREHHVARAGHTDGDDIVAPGPRVHNPAQLMIVACLPGIFLNPHCPILYTDTQTILYCHYRITAGHRHLYNPRNPAYFLYCSIKVNLCMSAFGYMPVPGVTCMCMLCSPH